MTVIDSVRQLPAVEVLARCGEGLAPAGVVRDEARRVIDRARARVRAGGSVTRERLDRELHAALLARGPMRRVVNATGVLLHTNLGRAPLDPLPDGYEGLGAVPVEMDLHAGARSRRLGQLEDDLAALTGAEAVLVVNNNAAALLLVLSALADGGEVMVSRGQLVEIGGSFRIPEIVTQGGAVLREVGTTNRTHLRDFRGAIGERTRMILEVHPSNFAQVGFTATVPTAAAATLAHEHDLVMVHDIGSGLVDARAPWLADGPPGWLIDEPAARQVLEAGADVVTFSGDKLLGGPQAGVICGRPDLLAVIRRHPLARALRYDKLRAAHLHAVVRAHLDGSAAERVAFWRMAVASLDVLDDRARRIAASVASTVTSTAPGAAPVVVEVVEVEDSAGAGAAAAQCLPGVAVAVSGAAPDALAAGLRAAPVPVVARIHDDRLLVSLRSIDPADDARVASALASAIDAGGAPVASVGLHPPS